MKQLIHKTQKAAKRLTFIDALLWGQMALTVTIFSILKL